MAQLRIIKYGHPMLRQKADPCKPGEVSPEFMADLIQTMYAEDGVGLAATQVNVAKQILVARDPEKNNLYIMLNPEIIAVSEKQSIEAEGCLSLPHLQAHVERAYKIEVKAQDPDGNPIHIKTKDIFARVLQHEIDHLNGILYIDRADLSTLVWLAKKGEGVDQDEIVKIPTNLRQVQERFTTSYHKDRKKIVFQ
jgi:peptide deformylase